MDTRETTRIQELEAKVAELTSLVERLAAPADADAEEAHEPVTTSRRRMFKLAGAAALGAVGASAASAMPAAADNGISLLGAANSTANVTRVLYTGTAGTSSAFVFGAGSWGSNFSVRPAALAGFTDTTAGAPANGIYGFTSNANGSGVVGLNSASNGKGVSGECTNGQGVYGKGSTGVYADGTTYGIQANATGASGLGVWGNGTFSGLFATSASGYALNASVTGKASVYLQPNNNFFGTSPKVPVRNRTDAHLAGELESIDGELWFCVADGTPGTWRKLTGPTVAGGYHAITPTRVYDSRAASPAQGALGAGGNKTISVKDGRDLTTGNVVTADLIPAGATAVTANVTVVNTVGGGFLTINPGGNTTVTAATVNWSETGQILNNGVSLTLNANREVTAIAGGGTTDFVIDVTGYFL